MKIHLVSYFDEHYARRREPFIASALASSFFDYIHVFSNIDIDPVFYQQVYEPVRNHRGGGYWIWKPYFVKKVFDTIPPGDILIYCDIGCTFNTKGKARFEEYIAMLTTEHNTVDFGLVFKEYQYTKQEVFDHFSSSKEVINSEQLVGGILLLKKCSDTAILIDQWYDTAFNHSFLFTDEKIVPQRQELIDHRHDQSIFSVIRKTHGANILSDETYFEDFQKDGTGFPFWATRLRS